MTKDVAIERKKRKVEAMFLHMDSHSVLGYVLDHPGEFEKLGLFEVAFVLAWSRTSRSNYLFDVRSLEVVLTNFCDWAELRAAGDRLPEGETFTVYRGVSGRGRFRRVRGMAWTASLDTACWFAMRYAKEDSRFADPAVYRATVCEDEVFFYTNERHEREFVCRPKRCTRMGLSQEDIDRRAEVVRRRMRAECNAMTAAAMKRQKAKG